MGLRLQHGDQIELSSTSDDAEALLDELAALLESDLDLVEQA
jgi:phosphotransferase system HPr-like phosphotransfer protein